MKKDFIETDFSNMNKIKEFMAKDEDELLDLVYSESDEDWRGEWIIPKDRLRIKDLFKYEKIFSLEIRLECEHNVRCYLDFGDGSPIKIIDDFSIIKKDGSLILKTDISHLYSKKKKNTVKLKVETTCPQEDYKTDIAYIRLKDMVIIKKLISPFELIIIKVKYLKSIMKNKGIIFEDIKFYSHIVEESTLLKTVS